MVSSFFSRLLFILVSAIALASCGGGGDGDGDSGGGDNGGNGGGTPTPVVETFTVAFNQESINIEPGKSQVIDYTLTREGDTNFNIEVSIVSAPEIGSVALDTDNNRLTYSSDAEGSGSFSVLFKSASLQINKQLVYQVKAPDVVDPDPGKPTIDNDQDFIIHLPSDHITIYEDETITLDLKRNYEMNEQIIEEFYFNTDNIQGSVSDDKSQITLTAIDSEEDTYGEITAVTNVNGILYESKMYVIYYNKNRDLTTTEPPVVALLEHEIQITPFGTTVKFFDIYDPDSDRISYRILSSPAFTTTHMMKVPGGYEITINAIAAIDPNANDLVLEVSDAKNIDIHTFNLVAKTNGGNSKQVHPVVRNTAQNSSDNRPPVLSIEENVTVSLIKEFTGNEKGQIAELAFVHTDPDGDAMTLSAKASVDGKYSFNIQPPYLYVSANDISDLQYDQITLTASDGKFDSKMTFHFYVKDNFLTFLGGNPNTAPMTNLPTQLTLLEGKRYEIPFNSSDRERHPFDIGIEKDSAFINTLLTDSNLVLTTLTPEISTQTSITIWLEDVFESRREHTININIIKNTAPKVALDFVATDEVDSAPYSIKEVEQTPVEVKVTVTDPDEPDLTPAFSFNSSFITVDYKDGIATINSKDLRADYKGQVKISATDEFGAKGEQVIDVEYQFKDPNNQFPVITIAKEAFVLLPGESGSTTISITDPENDPLTIDSKANSDDVTYTYNIATGKIDFKVADDAAFEQEILITITAAENPGLGLSQKNIVITVPKSPEAPNLIVDFYEPKVPEEVPFVITFSATDANFDDITMSTIIPNNSGLSAKIVETENVPGRYRGYLEVTPIDNVLSEKEYTFTLAATDSNNEVDSETIRITVQPVNDPPELEFVVLDGLNPGDSGEIILANSAFATLSYGIKDPDTTGQDVRMIYPVKSGRYEVEMGVFRDYTFFVDSFVTTASNQIRINGSSKRDMFGYLSANKGSLAVNGDTFQDTIKVQVQEEISPGSNSSHGDEKDVNVTLKFVNNKPTIASFDLIQLFENQTQVINLAITDGDIADRTSIPAGGEELCITINNSSSFIQLYDIRPSVPELIRLGQPYCDTDADGPLNQVRINTLAVSTTESEFFTINVNDGFENASQIVRIEILNN